MMSSRLRINYIVTIFALFFIKAQITFSQEEIRIGAILPLSGSAQSFGKEARLALENALSDMSQKRFTYRLIFEDDQLEASKAVSAAKKLVSIDKVQVIFSNWSYGGNAVASALRQTKVPNLVFAWDPHILAMGENNFLTAAPPAGLAEAIIKKIKAEGHHSIALLGFQEAGVKYAFDEIELAAQRAQIKIVSRNEFLAEDLSSFPGYVARLKQLSPDYLVTCLILPEFLELFKDLKIQGYSIPVATIGQAPHDESFKSLFLSRWWSADYRADIKSEERIRIRTGLQESSGYPAYYEALRSVITILEGAPPTLNTSSSGSYLQVRLNNYKQPESLFGPIYYNDRRLSTDRVVLENVLTNTRLE